MFFAGEYYRKRTKEEMPPYYIFEEEQPFMFRDDILNKYIYSDTYCLVRYDKKKDDFMYRPLALVNDYRRMTIGELQNLMKIFKCKYPDDRFDFVDGSDNDSRITIRF